MDATDRAILAQLQDDARISWAELGRRVGLTAPAVSERVHRLELDGVISGYHATVDLKAAGYGIVAFVRLGSVAPELLPQFERMAAEMDEVLEFHEVTGSEGCIMKVAVSSVEHLHRLIGVVLPYGQTTTSIVLRSPITWRRIAFAE